VLAALWRLSRLKFLAGGLLGGGLGTAVAAFEGGGVDWGAYALAQTAITSLHLMTHYANDFFDRSSDALAVRTPFSGGSGVLVDGSLQPAVALRAAAVCAVVGLAAAALLLADGKALAAAAGLVIAVLAWSYSAPPLRLLGRGLGEADTAIIVAICVPICAYAAQTARIDVRILASTLPAAAAMFVMMLCVEYPDVEPDAATGKRNLVVRLGRRASARLLQMGLWLVAVGTAAALALGAPLTLAPMLGVALPAATGLSASLRPGAPNGAARNAEIAARGVTFYFVVGFCSLLGYLSALP